MRYAPAERCCPKLLGAIGIAFAAAMVLGMLGATVLAATRDTAPAEDFRKVLFLGNSITLHEPAPEIGWVGNRGMAASVAEKDFVHIVTRSLAKASRVEAEVMVKNVATFERQYADYDLQANLKEAFEFKADLVIVAIGENVPALGSEQEEARFEASVV